MRCGHMRLGLWIAVGALLHVPLVSRGDFIMAMTTIGSPGNVADDTGLGAVGYAYQIGTYEVTVAQYVEFLNAVAQSDPYGLYNPSMTTGPEGAFIVRTGSDGSYSYDVVAGTENQPVRWVSWYDGLRLCNWLYNGQGDGDTETGSYELSLGTYALREPGATWVLPTEDEWYKAAYYDPDTGTYYDYPNGTDDVPAEPTDGTTPRVFNFGDDPYWAPDGPWIYFTSTGDTTGQSPFGTYDQGGNVREWLETRSEAFPDHLMRGGSFLEDASDLNSGTAYGADPHTEGMNGFRLVYLIPEPSTMLLGLLGAMLLSVLGKKSS
ncbi:MAG: PEP-CTERM sorting domain-containing protein [Alphaproteobacteria bacterium]|nr:PEP-CTERM sorting domain-containing protein [Alphaproteobacteria bacterium]